MWVGGWKGGMNLAHIIGRTCDHDWGRLLLWLPTCFCIVLHSWVHAGLLQLILGPLRDSWIGSYLMYLGWLHDLIDWWQLLMGLSLAVAKWKRIDPMLGIEVIYRELYFYLAQKKKN